jgi:hypothetical protein
MISSSRAPYQPNAGQRTWLAAGSSPSNATSCRSVAQGPRQDTSGHRQKLPHRKSGRDHNSNLQHSGFTASVLEGQRRVGVPTGPLG